jgi:GH43 family beta-xylosidase
MHVFTNPIAPKGADPWLIFHKKHKDTGSYYYCISSAQNGICVAEIKNIYDLAGAQLVKVWQPPEGAESIMYSKELWAPELHYLNGEWYIYVAADDGKNENHRMYVLKGTSQNPLDAFDFIGKITDSTDKWAIDGTVMQHKNNMYFIWSGWEGDVNVAQHTYIARMSDPCTISSERVKISSPELDWELISGPNLPTINEGAVAIERNGVHHIVYSASGSWSDDYCLGLLTLKGDNPLSADSWLKSEKPILSKTDKVFGPGHCSFTISPDGSQTWIIYHANLVSGTGWGGRSVWAQPVTWDENHYPVIGKPVSPGEKLEIAVNQ